MSHLKAKMHQIRWGAYSLLAGFKGAYTSKGREEKEGESKRGEREKGKKEKGRKEGEGPGPLIFWP